MRRSLALTFAFAVAGCGGASVSGGAREGFVSPVNVLQVRWSRHLTEYPLLEYKPQEFAAGTSDGERVFVGSSSSWFFALSAHDGQLLWRKKLDGAVTGRPRLHGSTVYVGTVGGVLYALDAGSGGQKWRYDLKGPVESQPLWSEGTLYFTSGENRVYALDAEKGTWKWQYDRESPESFTIRGSGAPLVYNGRVYVGFSDGYLAALSVLSGDVVWARSLAGEATRFVDVDSTPVVSGGTLYVSSYAGGVFALDPKDGSTKWRYEIEGAGSVRVSGGRVYFAAAKLGLHSLDLDGRLLWRQALAAGGELSSPLVVDDFVMVSSANMGTYVADARTGRLYQFFYQGHGITAEPTTDGRQVYVLSNGGYFYACALPSAQEPPPRHATDYDIQQL